MPIQRLVLVLMIVGLSIGLAGCGASGQRTARLEAGSKAIIDPVGGGKTVLLETDSKDAATTFSAFVLLDAGTTVEIEADEKTVPDSQDAGRRSVKVFVWDGPQKGVVGWLSRDDLWPSD